MKKSTMAVWALMASISCSLLAANGALAAKEEVKKDEVKKVVVSKKHGSSVKIKRHGKKGHRDAQGVSASEKPAVKHNSDTQKENQ